MTHTFVPSLEALTERIAPSSLTVSQCAAAGATQGTDPPAAQTSTGGSSSGGSGGSQAAAIQAKDLTAGSSALLTAMQTASQQTQNDLSAFAQKGATVTPAILQADLQTEIALDSAEHIVGQAEFSADADVAQQSTNSSAQLLELVKAQGGTFANIEAADQLLATDQADVTAAEQAAASTTTAS